MGRKNKKYLFYSYIVSYVGIVVLALSLLSSMAMWGMAESMKEEELRVMKNRLYTAVNDLEEQIETMRIITLNVASRSEFRKDTFEKNKYLEIEMLQNLKHYTWTTAICDFFFLKYRDADTIFTSDGTTSLFGVYCQNRIGQEARKSVKEAVEMAFEDKALPYVLVNTGNSSVLMVYPLQKYATSSIGMDGVLCFEIEEKLLKGRIVQTAGELPGSMEVFYEDFPILSENDKESADTSFQLEASSLNGSVRVLFRPEADDYFNWDNVYSPEMAAILIGIILLLLIIALAAARKSYAPIQKLVKKYDIKANTIGDNELDQIDSMIESMIQKEEKDGKRIQKQYQLLREQVLCAIVSEGYSPMLQSRLTMLNIRLDGSVFGKIVCDFDHWEEVLEDDGLISAAEELSDEGVEVHAFRTGGGRLTVLVSAEEEYQIEDIQEALASLFEAKGVVAKVKQQGVCHELEQLCNLSGKGEIQGKKNSTEGSRGEEPDREAEIHASEEGGGDSMEDFRKQSATAAYAVKYIDENFTQYDLSLDLVARNLHITSPYLCRLIKQQTGMNYKEYLTRLRMAEAKRLLKNKNASIADVCRQTGYSNVSHFIKTFQKYEGITPAKYRDIR